MPRYIDAEAIHYVEIGKGVEIALASDIDKIPTISPDEVRDVGHWITEQEAIDMDDYSLRDTCSVCGRCDWDCTESESFNYCPHCGARMEIGGAL